MNAIAPLVPQKQKRNRSNRPPVAASNEGTRARRRLQHARNRQVGVVSAAAGTRPSWTTNDSELERRDGTLAFPSEDERYPGQCSLHFS
jgi:hypothetical protein